MSRTLRLGISTCPNDTFAYHALLHGEVDRRGIDFAVELLDVEQLNRGLARGDFDVAKASFHAALRLAERMVVLPVGAALGHGVGPLLLAAPGRRSPADAVLDGGRERPARVLAPGDWTTATLLYRLFHAGEGRLEQVLFSEIPSALREGRAEFGVCIHEARFTWEREGLQRVEDLGETWERATGEPLPLGGLLARRELEPALLRDVVAVLGDSLDWAHAHREQTLPTMREHAQELDEDVLWAHVDTYVNRDTRRLGERARSALGALGELARERGLLPGAARGLEVLADAAAESSP